MQAVNCKVLFVFWYQKLTCSHRCQKQQELTEHPKTHTLSIILFACLRTSGLQKKRNELSPQKTEHSLAGLILTLILDVIWVRTNIVSTHTVSFFEYLWHSRLCALRWEFEEK